MEVREGKRVCVRLDEARTDRRSTVLIIFRSGGGLDDEKGKC